MFAFVEGLIDDISEDLVVVDVGGFGVNAYVSSNTIAKIGNIGDHVKLYTYTQVREDAISLYGFLDRSELKLFKKLLTVNGIGPKGALSILSVMDIDALCFAIVSGDAKAISSAPGIGAKTAQRVILELKDKVSMSDDAIIREISNPAKSIKINDNPEISDAIAALVSLGYPQTSARNAVEKIENVDQMDSGSILSAALKLMF